MPDRCTIRPDGRTVMCRTSDPNTNLGIRRTQSGRTIWAKQRNLSHSEGKALQQKTGLPFCDGSGFPYVKGCYSDMSNWSGGPNPKQCIITNPGTSNLAPYSIYTCGFLW